MIDTVILIGPRLKLARKNARLSQKELAALCGIGQSHISAIERNARAPSIEMLASLADALSVTSHWLLGGDSCATLGDTETGRAHILADSKAAPGLESLAGDLAMCAVLNIQPTEWQALRSLTTPHPITKGICGNVAGVAGPSSHMTLAPEGPHHSVHARRINLRRHCGRRDASSQRPLRNRCGRTAGAPVVSTAHP